MELSARIRKEAKNHGVEPQTLVMADLMAIGYSENEAYNIAYSENALLDKKHIITLRENIVFSVGFKDLVQERATIIKGREAKNLAADQMSKDEVASQLKLQIDMLPDGSKEKADVLMKYADLFAMKKEDKKSEEEEVIRIWMPLTCDICPYKKNAARKRP